MKSLRIEVDEKSYKHILFLLKNLKIKGLRIIEEDTTKKRANNHTKESLKKLFNKKNVELFKTIDNPLEWQRNQRDQWD